MSAPDTAEPSKGERETGWWRVWQSCPICGGRGSVDPTFYTGGDSSSTASVTCRTCLGKGVVVTPGAPPPASPSVETGTWDFVADARKAAIDLAPHNPDATLYGILVREIETLRARLGGTEDEGEVSERLRDHVDGLYSQDDPAVRAYHHAGALKMLDMIAEGELPKPSGEAWRKTVTGTQTLEEARARLATPEAEQGEARETLEDIRELGPIEIFEKERPRDDIERPDLFEYVVISKDEGVIARCPWKYMAWEIAYAINLRLRARATTGGPTHG